MIPEVRTFLTPDQTKRPSLSADFGWTFIGNAVYSAGQFATLMLLAKLLRLEQVGQYALGLAIVYPAMMFTNLQLRAVLSSGNHKEFQFGDYLGLRLLTTSLAFVIIYGVTRILGYGRELTNVVLMVGLAYAIETFSDVYYARLQLHDRLAAISKSMMARGVLAALALAATTYVTRNLLWAIAAIVLARVIVLLSYDARQETHGLSRLSQGSSRNKALKPRFELGVFRKLAWVSLPLGIVILLGCLNSSVPCFFIKHALGERGVGTFAALGFMVSAGNMAVISLGQSAYTRLARTSAEGNCRAFYSLLSKLLAFGAVIGLGGMFVSKLAGREILTLLFHPEYAERADLLPWMMAAGGVLFMAQFLGFGMTAANYYNSQIAINILGNISLLVACSLLVGRFGLLGAILAMLVAATVQLAGSAIVLALGMRERAFLSAGEVSAGNVDRTAGATTISLSPERSPAINVGD